MMEETRAQVKAVKEKAAADDAIADSAAALELVESITAINNISADLL